MTEEMLVETLESYLRYTNSGFGRYAASRALKRLKGGFNMHALSNAELMSLRELQKWRPNEFPNPKRVWPETVPALERTCPFCGRKIWGNARIVRVIEKGDLHLVTILCKCKTIFRKYELVREET